MPTPGGGCRATRSAVKECVHGSSCTVLSLEDSFSGTQILSKVWRFSSFTAVAGRWQGYGAQEVTRFRDAKSTCEIPHAAIRDPRLEAQLKNAVFAALRSG